MIAINCAVFCYDNGNLKVLLSKKRIDSTSKWGVLSGTLQNNETADEAALRVLGEFGAENYIFLRQLKTFIDADYDSADRVVTIGYYAVIDIANYKENFVNPVFQKKWHNAKDVPNLIFSHNKILDLSLYQLGTAVRGSSIGFDLLPKEFTLSELTNLYQEILDIDTNEFVFCRKIVQKKVVVPIEEKHKVPVDESEIRYKFNSQVFDKLIQKEFSFHF